MYFYFSNFNIKNFFLSIKKQNFTIKSAFYRLQSIMAAQTCSKSNIPENQEWSFWSFHWKNSFEFFNIYLFTTVSMLQDFWYLSKLTSFYVNLPKNLASTLHINWYNVLICNNFLHINIQIWHISTSIGKSTSVIKCQKLQASSFLGIFFQMLSNLANLK